MDQSFALTRTDGPVTSLAQIDGMLSRMLDTLLRNSFFFLDEAFAGDRRNKEHHGYLRGRLLEGLENLTALGLFRSDFTPETRETVLSMLLMTHVTWLQKAKAAFLRAHWVILTPYLTPRGLEELTKMQG